MKWLSWGHTHHGWFELRSSIPRSILFPLYILTHAFHHSADRISKINVLLISKSSSYLSRSLWLTSVCYHRLFSYKISTPNKIFFFMKDYVVILKGSAKNISLFSHLEVIIMFTLFPSSVCIFNIVEIICS